MLKQIINQEQEAEAIEDADASDKKGGEGKNESKSKGSSGSSASLTGNKNVLSNDVEIKGKLRFSRDLIIDGRIEGEVNSEGDLTGGENSHIIGDIKTRSVIVYGKVQGNITVTDRCELKQKAELNGDITASKLAIEEGAVFLGSSTVGGGEGKNESKSKGSSGSSASLTGNKNVLSNDVEIKGKLRFSRDLIIDGRIEGEVNSEGDLTVGENAQIIGDIKTRSVVVFGKVQGNITVTDRCELKQNAELNGDVTASKLAIEEGAVFLGSSTVRGGEGKNKSKSKGWSGSSASPAGNKTILSNDGGDSSPGEDHQS